jgi:3-hydroxyisobutyrate dehydrogenase-like beta-hydroxyacid dehydrogenase
MTKIAVIGLGRMGQGKAGRYLDTGFTVAFSIAARPRRKR